MASGQVLNAVHKLSDLELALLVCLVADQHCIIRVGEHRIQELQNSITSICSETFGLTCVALNCSERTTLADISDAAVLKDDSHASDGEYLSGPRTSSRLARTSSADRTLRGVKRPLNVLDNRKIAHAIIATNLERDCRDVQIQVLELMRSRRIFSRTAVHAASRRFLVIALQSTSAPGPPFYTPFLNDYFFISHTVPPYQHGSSLSPREERSSVSSMSSTASTSPQPLSTPVTEPRINEDVLTVLQSLTQEVQMTAEMRRYIHNIVTFLRLHRHVFNGVSSIGTRHFDLLSRVLAPLHGLKFVTPSLVGIAAKKVYLHRIEVVEQPRQERSMQWGSDEEAVKEEIPRMTEEAILDNVVNEVECPA